MRKWIPGMCFLGIILFTLVNGTGCGTTNSVYRIGKETAKEVSDKLLPGAKPILKKKVLLTPVMNLANVKNEKVAQLTETLLNLLEKDDSLLITLSAGPSPSRDKMRSPQFGVIIDPELVQKAVEMGMNVLITCVLQPLEEETKTSGIWPLHRVKKEVVLSMSLNAVDTTSGTLLLNRLETRRLKIRRDESETQDEPLEIDDETLREELSSILKDLSSAVLDTLNDQYWSGRLEMTSEGYIKINGGEDIGIKDGSVFEVYGKKDSIRSVSGKSYYFLGPKDGEIRVEKTMEDYSLAVPLDNKHFENGQIVRLKR